MTNSVKKTKRRSLHTLGPWSVEDPIGGQLSIVEANKPAHEWRVIATVYLRERNDHDEFPHHVSEANAHLIAAAPDLLLALRAVREWMDNPEANPECPLSVSVASAIRIAIAKAEGRS